MKKLADQIRRVGLVANPEKSSCAAVVQQAARLIRASGREPVADEASTAEPAPPVSGWIVQVASAASEDAAWSTWKKMQKRHKALAGQSPVVVRADLGAKGTFYRVRLTGYDSQQAAKSACAKLKSGGVTCYISKASS